MNTTKTEPFDIFSSLMRIPFNIAAYSRQHKLCVETVDLRKAIQLVHARKHAVASAEALLAQAEGVLDQALVNMTSKMTRDPI